MGQGLETGHANAARVKGKKGEDEKANTSRRKLSTSSSKTSSRKKTKKKKAAVKASASPKAVVNSASSKDATVTTTSDNRTPTTPKQVDQSLTPNSDSKQSTDHGDNNTNRPKNARKKNKKKRSINKKEDEPLEPILIRPTNNSNMMTLSKKTKNEQNELTHLIPGYTAERTLHASSLEKFRPTGGVEALTQKAQLTDASTKNALVGTAIADKHTQVMTGTSSATGLPSTYLSAYASFKKGTKRTADTSAGAGWFHMEPTPMTDDLKTDMALIRNRAYLDPKRFYKSADMKAKYVQRGTVIEGAAEFYAARLTKKQRRSNLTEELMADPDSANYAKNKFKKMQQAKNDEVLQRKQFRKKRKGKRNFS